MPLFIFFVVLCLIFNFIPGLYRLIELFFIGPLLGLTFGGFIWGVAALAIPALLCFPAFVLFVFVAMVLSWKWMFSN